MLPSNNILRRKAIATTRQLLSALPFNAAILIAKEVLAAQGFGAGAQVDASGEERVFRLVKSNIPLLFDCGGHVGDYTGMWLDTFPSGRSFVFEPSAAHIDLLEKRFSDVANVRVFPIGLGADDAELNLYKNSEISGLASLSQRRLDHHGIVMDQVETVRIRRIDDVIKENDIAVVDLLKIDVEGHELSVLEGARESLRSNVIKLVQFEFGGCNLDTHTNLQDFFYFFKNLDYVMGIVQPYKKVHIIDKYEEFFEQYRTTNFVAARKSVFSS